MGRLDGKVAIVTGAGSGMGRASARLFAAEGASVVCADRSGAQDDAAKEIGAAAVAVQVDVSDSAQVKAMVDTAVAAFGRLDVLFNNAGFGGAYASLTEVDEETFDRIVATNFKGVYLGMRHAIPVMIAQGGGSIVNTTSAAALVGMKNLSIYGGAKGAVVMMSKSAALDYADRGIRINCVCPGVTWTGLAGGAVDQPPPDREPPIKAPITRWGLAGDIASAALFFASDESSFVTGTALAVDGGYSIGSFADAPAPPT
ncbi:MAG TPA: SDR family oxidoreductase [Trebonia sp.]|jgi:NAD(P)-dependent dehydrogenase (short-subunit alcohol dehydrogenase family)